MQLSYLKKKKKANRAGSLCSIICCITLYATFSTCSYLDVPMYQFRAACLPRSALPAATCPLPLPAATCYMADSLCLRQWLESIYAPDKETLVVIELTCPYYTLDHGVSDHPNASWCNGSIEPIPDCFQAKGYKMLGWVFVIVYNAHIYPAMLY